MDIHTNTISNIIIVLAFIACGLVGSMIADFIAPPRIDPFTGAEGKALEIRVQSLEQRILELENAN